MKEKTVEIHFRVSEKEKKMMEKNAKNSGTSLSSYLRKVGLKEKIYPIPDKEFFKIYVDICKVRNHIYDIEIEKIDRCLEIIENNFLDIYYPNRNGDDTNSNNKNMDD